MVMSVRLLDAPGHLRMYHIHSTISRLANMMSSKRGSILQEDVMTARIAILFSYSYDEVRHV